MGDPYGPFDPNCQFHLRYSISTIITYRQKIRQVRYVRIKMQLNIFAERRQHEVTCKPPNEGTSI